MGINYIDGIDVSIEGNKIVSTATQAITPAFLYDGSIYINAAHALITDNVFSSHNDKYNGNNLPMIQMDGYARCFISNNTFIKEDSAIYAYIQDLTTQGQHTIVDNFFDSPTCDEPDLILNGNIPNDENLVKGLGPSAIYDRNVNQTNYTTIDLYPHFSTKGGAISDILTGVSYHYSLRPSDSLYDSAFDSIMQVNFSTTLTTAGFLTWHFSLNLSEYLPNNVNILYAKCGIGGTPGPGGFVYIDDSGSPNITQFVLNLFTTNSSYKISDDSLIDVRTIYDNFSGTEISGGAPGSSAEALPASIITDFYAITDTTTRNNFIGGTKILKCSADFYGVATAFERGAKLPLSNQYWTGNASNDKQIRLKLYVIYHYPASASNQAQTFLFSPVVIKYRYGSETLFYRDAT